MKPLESIPKPPIPLSSGHLCLLVKAGAANGLIGSGKDAHILRVTTRKVEGPGVTTHERKGSKLVAVTRSNEHYETRIRILTRNGEIIEVQP